MLGGDIKSAITGAAFGAAFGYIGAQDWGNSQKIYAHGVTGGAQAEVSGGKFKHGFLSAGFTKWASPSIEGVVGDRLTTPQVMGRTFMAAAIGGTASALGGGKFANGAVTGAFSRLFNTEGKKALAQKKAWPVPGHRKLNSADKPGEGDGAFGSCRGSGCTRPHRGIDIEAPVGRDVVAYSGGTVVPISPNPSSTYGNQVVIDHGNGVFSQSAHLDTLNVSPGDTVTAGQLIGTVGRTGNTPRTGDSHLHFEIRIGSKLPVAAGGTTDDPMKYLP